MYSQSQKKTILKSLINQGYLMIYLNYNETSKLESTIILYESGQM